MLYIEGLVDKQFKNYKLLMDTVEVKNISESERSTLLENPIILDDILNDI